MAGWPEWPWNGVLHYGKAGNKVVEKAGDNGWDTQRTEAMHGLRKKSHVDSNLFPIGFWWGCTWFGIRKGTDRNKQQPDAFAYHPSPLFFPPDPHRQARIVEDGIIYYNKAGYKVVEKDGDSGWDTQRTEAMHRQRRKYHVDSTLFPTGFWWGCTWFGIWKGTNQEGPMLHHLTSSILLRGQLLESTLDNPDST